MSDTSKREQLIEEAAKAIKPRFDDYCVDADAEDHAWEAAEAALSVFEQAHTPTSDERTWVTGFLLGCGVAPDRAEEYAGKLLAAGFRRTAVQEPSVDLCEWCDMSARGNAWHPGHDQPRRSCGEQYHGEGFEPDPQAQPDSEAERLRAELAAMTAEKETWRIRCAEETVAWADEATEKRRLLGSEPQGEPTDAHITLRAFLGKAATGADEDGKPVWAQLMRDAANALAKGVER